MQKIKHLHWRAGFGLSPREFSERRDWTVQKAVDGLFAEAAQAINLAAPSYEELTPEMMNEEEAADRRKKEKEQVADLNVAWIERMGNPEEAALVERMSLFWHGHFACRTVLGSLAANQLNMIRRHALDNFRDLLLGVARDPSMIRYLNNQQNRKQKPNENFARELLELFTIGRGHYTEQDIKEAARAFTGWSSNLAGEFVFRNFHHDFEQKTFFGKTGRFNGEDIVDLILEKKETARFIAAKVYRYFVNETVDDEIVRYLADVFYRTNYDIAALMRAVFESDWFYEEKNRGAKIKSPVDLMAGMIRSLGVSFEQKQGLLMVQRTLGQVLFNPPNVAGWPGGKSWIDNATLMFRLNLGGYLLGAAEINQRDRIDLQALDRGQNPKRLAARVELIPLFSLLEGEDPAGAFDQLSDYFLQIPPTVDYRTVSTFVLKNTRENLLKTMVMRILSLPEYQMC